MGDNAEKSRFDKLTLLSASEKRYPKSPAEAKLECFDNLYADRDYGIESKSLKLYLDSFRNANIFHEEAVNSLLNAVVATCKPRRAEVIGRFRPRGGIAINVKATYGGKVDEF